MECIYIYLYYIKLYIKSKTIRKEQFDCNSQFQIRYTIKTKKFLFHLGSEFCHLTTHI